MVNTDVHIGYVLHSRPFRDTSAIVEFFFRDIGRVPIIFKGIKRSGKSAAKSRLLQPFSRLAVGFYGRSDMKTGTLVESDGHSVLLQGKQLFSGMYLNELLTRLLHRHEPYGELFELYEAALQNLLQSNFEPTLRIFEHHLLSQLGYEIPLFGDATGADFHTQSWYLYEPEQGFVLSEIQPPPSKLLGRCFVGSELMAIAQQQYEDEAVLKAAKRLSRLALAPHLGDQPLQSRKLFS